VTEWLDDRELKKAQQLEADALARIAHEPARPWRTIKEELGLE